MLAYLIERLYPTGWRRDGQVFWRLADAAAESDRALAAGEVRGTRILAARVCPDALAESFAARSEAAR